jgi:GAF domain-containing protein/anti-sigma regulatory factor (Ser/Thr protein kinase)
VKARSLHKIGELLDALERTTGEPGHLTGTLRHVAETAQRFFKADDCVIYAINPITARFVESLTLADDQVESKILFGQPRQEGITLRVLQQSVLLVEQLEEKPEYLSTFTQARGIKAFIGLALYMKYGQKPLGVLYLDFKAPQHFSRDDYELFQNFAEQASYILQETWLVRRYREVARIGQEINQELSTVESLFQKLHQHVSGILDISYTLSLSLYLSPTNMHQIHMYNEGEISVRHNLQPRGATQHVIETQQTFFSLNMSEEEEEKRLPFKRTSVAGMGKRESVIFVPLVLRGISLGALSIQHPEPGAYNREDRFILELLGNHIALALYNIRLYDSLNRLNETGQFLTQQIESAQVLQETVYKIRQATEADTVILFPYDPPLQRFILPPHVSGDLLDPALLHSTFLLPHDIAVLALKNERSIFAKDGASIYTTVGGNRQTAQVNFQQRENIQSVAIMPLSVGELSVGVLFLNFRKPQQFDTPQSSLIEGLAHYAAIAIKNAQVFGALSQRRIHELEILQKIDRELSHTLDLKTVLDTILSLGYEHLKQAQVEEASILLYDPQTLRLETKAAIGRHVETSLAQVISIHETKAITRWALEHKLPVRVKNVHREEPWRELHLPVASDIISELDVPMLDGDEVVGILNFESTREGAFGEEEELFLVTLAGQAVLAIKKAQAYEREKRFAEEGKVFTQISKEIIGQRNPERVFHLILEKALELTKSTNGLLMLYDPDRDDLWMAAGRGLRESNSNIRVSLDEGVVGYVARTMQALNVDPSQSPWSEIYLDYIPSTRSELAVPLRAGDALLGVLNVESTIPGNFKPDDERLLIGLADLAVVALQNARAFEREQRSATISQALNEISQEIASKLDPVYIYHLILRKALDLTGSTIGSLHLYDPDLNDLQMAAEFGVAEEKRGQRQKLGRGIVGYTALQKLPSSVKDVTQPPWNEIYVEFFPGVRSELAVPMLEGNELRGVLNVESLEVDHFHQDDEQLLRGLADLSVVALQSTERYKKAGREAQHSEMLYQAGRELANITNWEQLENVYDIILHIAEDHSPCQVVIRRYDDVTQELVLERASRYQSAPPFERIKLDEGLNGQVARERRTGVIHDTQNPPPDMIVKLSDTMTRSLLITPVKFKDRYYGNLALGHRDTGYFRGSEVGFFEGLADQLASTIYRLETARARQEFEKISSFGQSAFELTHRLANDLGLVEFYVDGIQRQMRQFDMTDESIAEHLNEIVQSVRKVLSFSTKLKQELVSPEGEEPMLISPQELLSQAMSASPLSPSIRISMEISSGVGLVRVARSQVAEILHNLVSNAIDAMPQGGKIILQAYNSGRYVALEVIDTGTGIPAQQLKEIFDLTFSTKKSSGFGLWSARRYALLNQGELIVESHPGHTMFTLLLPRTDGGIA